MPTGICRKPVKAGPANRSSIWNSSAAMRVRAGACSTGSRPRCAMSAPRCATGVRCAPPMLADAAMRVEGEAAELLRWFEGGAMTQLGHEWRTRDGKVQEPLGISESADGQLLSPAALEAAFAWFDKGGHAPLLIKSNRLSAVHRRRIARLLSSSPKSRARRSSGCRSTRASGRVPRSPPRRRRCRCCARSSTR